MVALKLVQTPDAFFACTALFQFVSTKYWALLLVAQKTALSCQMLNLLLAKRGGNR